MSANIVKRGRKRLLGSDDEISLLRTTRFAPQNFLPLESVDLYVADNLQGGRTFFFFFCIEYWKRVKDSTSQVGKSAYTNRRQTENWKFRVFTEYFRVYCSKNKDRSTSVVVSVKQTYPNNSQRSSVSSSTVIVIIFSHLPLLDNVKP